MTPTDSARAGFLAFPGDIDTPTGGYAYDRKVMAHIPAHGFALAPLALPADFPFPSEASIDSAAARLAAVPADAALLVDGLALGALPARDLARIRARLTALVHHPLALEAGLEAAEQEHLARSERAALACCRQVIATSPRTAAILVADYGVAPEHLTVAEPGTDPAPRAPCDGTPVRLLAIGSVIPRKGYDILIRALAQIAPLHWTATIYGSLDMAPETVRALRGDIAAAGLSGRIQLVGAVAPDMLEDAYGASDLFVHPSLYEGYGMVLAEAMRRGLPVVCTTGGAAAETVPDGAGRKVPPGDVEALAGALGHLIADPEDRRALSDRAFAAGSALPGWDMTAARIAAALRRASAPPAPSPAP